MFNRALTEGNPKVLLAGLTTLILLTSARGQGVRLEAGLNLAGVSKADNSNLQKSMLASLQFGLKADL